MAPKGTKRPSTESSVEISQVSKALRSATSPTATVAKMLASMVTSSLGVYKDERHSHQQEVVDMIEAALNERAVSMQATIDALKIDVEGAASEKGKRATALSEAESGVAKAKAYVEECKSGVATAKEGLVSAETELKATLAKQKEGDKGYVAKAAKKTTVESALEAFSSSKDTKVTAGVLKEIKSVGTEYGVDSTMLASLPLALNKAPATRSSFDTVILDQFAEALKKVLAEQNALVEAEEPAKAERQGVVDAAKGVKNAAADALKAKEATLNEATEAEKAAKAAKRNAEGAVKNYVLDMKKLMDGFDDAKVALKEFQEGPLSVFAEFKGKVAPPPEPELPAEEPPAAPEAEAVPPLAAA